MAVLPEKQGKGIASKLMTFAEKEVKIKGAKYLRMDCRTSYEDLVKFYENRGFNKVGTILDDEDNNEPYFLMEKAIPNNS